MTGTQIQPGPLFAAHVARTEERVLVRLVGELDLATVRHAERAIAEAERERGSALEVDLSSLAFLDSTGLRLFLKTRERAQAAGRRLVLRRGPRAVQRVFEVTALEPLFEFSG